MPCYEVRRSIAVIASVHLVDRIIEHGGPQVSQVMQTLGGANQGAERIFPTQPKPVAQIRKSRCDFGEPALAGGISRAM